MSNKVKIYKGDLVNAIYPCELDGYKKNGWSDKPVAPEVKQDAEVGDPAEAKHIKPETKFKRGK